MTRKIESTATFYPYRLDMKYYSQLCLTFVWGYFLNTTQVLSVQDTVVI